MIQQHVAAGSSGSSFSLLHAVLVRLIVVVAGPQGRVCRFAVPDEQVRVAVDGVPGLDALF